MAALKFRRVDEGVGATFPDDVLAQLNLREGDTLQILNTPEGILLTPVDTQFPTEMEAARRVMDENEAVLRRLAK